MIIVEKSVIELIPYARNSRTHSDEQISQIMASITEFGFTNPILIDEKNEIIAGHGRLVASQRLKLEKVPCIVLDNLTEAQKKAYVIANNKIALNAGWDEDLLRLELIELDEMNFDYSEFGFDFDIKLENDIENVNLKNEDYKEKFSIVIDCDSELHQEQIFYKLTNEGLKCRVQSL